jgi:hypothetical protein
MSEKEFLIKCEQFLNENKSWIKEILEEYGRSGFMDVFYDQPEFEEFIESLNTNTEEEEEVTFGWTTEKDELFDKVLIPFIKNLRNKQ